MAEVEKTSNQPIGSAFDLIGKSVEIVKENWQAFAVVNIIALISAVVSVFPEPSEQEIETTFSDANIDNFFSGLSGTELGALLGGGLLIFLAFAAINIFLYAMAVNLEVKSTSGQKPGVSELVKDARKYFWRLIGLTILQGLIILVGLLLLIVPGVIAIGRLIMSPYHMVDKDLGIADALRKSSEQAKRHGKYVWSAIGVSVLVGFGVGVFELFPLIGSLLGTLFAIAISLIIPLRYQQLKRLENQAPSTETEVKA